MLSDYQELHLTTLLEGLVGNKKLSSKETQFVDDTNTRYEKYGSEIYVSPKQLSWLERLYRSHVGPLT